MACNIENPEKRKKVSFIFIWIAVFLPKSLLVQMLALQVVIIVEFARALNGDSA
jgi:hypothetical protein